MKRKEVEGKGRAIVIICHNRIVFYLRKPKGSAAQQASKKRLAKIIKEDQKLKTEPQEFSQYEYHLNQIKLGILNGDIEKKQVWDFLIR